jgi:hypothetical protein
MVTQFAVASKVVATVIAGYNPLPGVGTNVHRQEDASGERHATSSPWAREGFSIVYMESYVVEKWLKIKKSIKDLKSYSSEVWDKLSAQYTM